MKKLTKGGLLQGKKKGKKVVKQEKGEVKSKGKKSKEPLRRISSDRGSGSPALSAAGSSKAPTRRTRTSRVSDEWIDQEALNEFIATNAPPGPSRASCYAAFQARRGGQPHLFVERRRQSASSASAFATACDCERRSSNLARLCRVGRRRRGRRWHENRIEWSTRACAASACRSGRCEGFRWQRRRGRDGC